jgi:hypothetical protein
MGPASSSLLAGRCWKLCTEAWPQYALGDQEKWLSQGSLNYNTILQLDLFYKSKKSKLRFPIQISLIRKMSAQHVQSPGLNSPALLKKKKMVKKISGINITSAIS